jgi:SNF2 family DNA or RNA helicase|tara:strand:+ start:2347 stop:4083 length:1737 start_codon:yes stop_codon:yes gene_type:complete
LEVNIPEREASKILESYSGANNYILGIKEKCKSRYYKLSRNQSEYIIEHKNSIPKIARKWAKVDTYYGLQLQEKKLLTTTPEQIWVEKILVEQDRSYQIWGKVLENEQLYSFWVPKSQIVPTHDKKVKVDYTPFNHRPPLPHQETAIEKLLINEKYILADDMGLGKTTSAVIASIVQKSRKTLIICPASLKLNWKREIENYFKGTVGIVDGKNWVDDEYIIINYDILKNFHSLDNDKKREILNSKFDLVIIDEAHYISNAKAQRTKVVNQITSKIKNVWLLSGTPMTSRPINYYNLLNIVESRATTNWVGYVLRYCAGRQFRGPGGRKIWDVNGASNLDELRERTKDKVLRRLKEEVIDLPDKIITPLYQELKSKEYEKELGEYVDWSDGNQNQGLAIHLAKLMKVRQIIANDKVDITCELISQALEQEKKVIVFTNFTAPLMAIHEKFKKNSVVLHGSLKKEERQKSVDDFQTDPNIKVFISNLKAGGVGITLTAAEVVIMNDLSFVPSDHSQAEDRAFRIGQKKNVSILYPLYENTIEQIIYNILQKKKNIIDTVMGDNMSDNDIFQEILSELKTL